MNITTAGITHNSDDDLITADQVRAGIIESAAWFTAQQFAQDSRTTVTGYHLDTESGELVLRFTPNGNLNVEATR